MSQEEHPAVTNFREYIRIRTVPPHPDYAKSTEFLRRQGKELGAEIQEFEFFPGYPIVILTLPGTDPSLPSLMLNSHTDVVPVFPEHWKYEPFSAHKEENGDIYGRGTQDMKCVGIQYIEALKKLKKQGQSTFLRTIHLTFVPDEETNGTHGMVPFSVSEEFRKLNVGLSLDEGYANPGEEMFLFYGERAPWNVYVTCKGLPGHGSQFIQDTAAEKMRRVINSFLSFRDQEEARLNSDPKLTLGDVTTVNLTLIEGGVQFNVVPSEMKVGFNIRVPPTVDFDEMEERLRGWCTEAGKDVTMKIEDYNEHVKPTCIEDGKNPWWDAFAGACEKENIKLKKEIFPGATDSRYIRNLGIPALGFSPMNHTPLLLHDHNEFLNEKIFLRGIDIYTTIIPALANLKP